MRAIQQRILAQGLESSGVYGLSCLGHTISGASFFSWYGCFESESGRTQVGFSDDTLLLLAISIYASA